MSYSSAEAFLSSLRAIVGNGHLPTTRPHRGGSCAGFRGGEGVALTGAGPSAYREPRYTN